MSALEEAVRRLVVDAAADRCGALAYALGVECECGASDEECEGCASRIAAAVSSRMMPDGMEWPRFEDGEPVRFGDEALGKGGAAFGVTRVCFVDGGCYFNSSRNPDGSKRGRGWRYGIGERVARPCREDAQERIDEDAAKAPCDYFGWAGVDCNARGGCPALRLAGRCREAKALDLLRRQRELCAKEAGR